MLRGFTAFDTRQVGLDQLQWVGKWICCVPATCHRTAVSKTSKHHRKHMETHKLAVAHRNRYLASTFSFIDWVIDWFIAWINPLIDRLCNAYDSLGPTQKWKKLVATSLTFCDCSMAANGSSSYWNTRFASSSSPSWSDTRIFRRKWSTQQFSFRNENANIPTHSNLRKAFQLSGGSSRPWRSRCMQELSRGAFGMLSWPWKNGNMKWEIYFQIVTWGKQYDCLLWFIKLPGHSEPDIYEGKRYANPPSYHSEMSWGYWMTLISTWCFEWRCWLSERLLRGAVGFHPQVKLPPPLRVSGVHDTWLEVVDLNVRWALGENLPNTNDISQGFEESSGHTTPITPKALVVLNLKNMTPMTITGVFLFCF